MNDPHVVALRYRLKSSNDVTFENPPPVEDETSAFHMRLENDVLTFKLKEHFPSADTARIAIDDYLPAWGIAVGAKLISLLKMPK